MKQIIYSILSVFCTIIFTQSLYAQTEYTSLVPNAPETAAIGEYIDSPMNEYSGLPGISIPLTSISDNGISVPVSISYHAGGIRVAEEATRVGLGWSLSTSGVITREIRDKDDFGFVPSNLNVIEEPLNGYTPGFVTAFYESGDEDFYGYFPNGSNFAWANWVEQIAGGYQTINSAVFGNNALEKYTGIDGKSYSTGEVFCYLPETDTQSDIYKFSFLGNSGSFVMDYQGNFICLDNHNIKIELDDVNQSWTLTDEYGTRYTFGISDNSKQRTFSQSYDFSKQINTSGTFNNGAFQSGNPPITNHISSWHLDRVESVQGGDITFTYLKDAKGIKALPSATEKITKKIRECNINLSGNGIDETDLINTHHLYLNKTTYDDVRLFSISNSKNQKIEFVEKTQSRIDLLGSSALESIKKITNGNLEKEVLFTQSYIYADENDPNVWTSKIWALNPQDIYEDVLSTNEYTRLRLDEVQIRGGSESLPPYKFSYNEDELPPKTSFSIDHWGYYNGIVNNTLLPYFRIQDVTDFGFGVCDDKFSLVFDYANKDSDEDKTQTGILETITSPTGFTQSFDYELHSFQNLNNENFSFSQNICDAVEFDFMVDHYSPDNAFIIESFEIPDDFDGLLSLEIDGKGVLDNNNPCFDPSFAFVANIEFKNLDNGNTYNIPINGNDNYEIDADGNFSFFKKNDIQIDPGKYKLTLSSNCIPNTPWLVDISNVEIYAKISNFCNTNKGAGLRVKRITNFDGVNNIVIKDYDYKESGICDSYMTYAKKYILQLAASSQESSKLGSMIDLSSNSQVPFSNPFSSQLIGYGKVKTSYSSEGEKYGSQESIYHIKSSTLNSKARFGLFQTARFSSSRNGKLITQTIRNSKEKVINKKTYSYDNFWLEFDWVWSFKIQPWVNLVDQIGTIFCSEILLISSHAFVPQWHRLTNVTEEKYGTEGGDALIISTNYDYYDTNHKTKSETISDGVISKTIEYEYAHNFGNQMLIDANMIGALLRTQINDGDGGGSQVNYIAHQDYILPNEYFTIDKNGTLSKKVATLHYDNDDQYPDRVESRAKNNMDEVIWGSGGEQGLVIEILNNNRLSEFDYNTFRNIEEITDYNSISSAWLYDGLQRPTESTANNTRLKNLTSYTYGLQNGSENIITNEMVNSDGTGYNSSATFDGLGRSIKSIKEEFLDGGSDHVSTVTYGPFGNILSKTVPEEGGESSFTYELSPLRRPLKAKPAGSNKSIITKHKIDGNKFLSETIDENGNTTKSYADIFGRQTKTIDALGNATSYTYNDRDQILTIQPPLGAPYVYTYYQDGLLWTKEIPDKGKYTYTYNDHDQLWIEILPNGKKLEYIYDDDYNDFLTAIKLDDITIKEYEFHDASKVKDWIGKESVAIFRPNGSISPTLHTTDYDYNEQYGEHFGVPTQMVITTLNGMVTEDMVYDNLGNTLSIDKSISGPTGTIAVNNTSTYSKGIRRKNNWTFADGVGIGTNAFIYNDNDWLTDANLGDNIQEIDYSYNPRGWLTAINSVNSTYLNEDPCSTTDVIPDKVDCDKIISIIQSFLVEYNCTDLLSDQPTGLKISKKVQYFEGEEIAQAATLNEYFIPINEGQNDGSIQFSNSFNFDLNNGLDNENISLGILELLIDCIQNNPGLLDLINNQINGILGNEVGGSNPSGNEFPSSTNNKDDVFGMEIHYTDGNGELNAAPQYNGNISWMEWRSKTDQRHAYGFTYDAINRLLIANYGEITSSIDCKIKKTDKYSVPNILYDALGNITNLERNGLTDFDDVNLISAYGPIDQLNYNYSGTSLLNNVTDGSSDTKGFRGQSSNYAYEFGNLISDTQKGIEKIDYTYNDLPLSITVNGEKIKNWYTADGLKIKSEIESAQNPSTRKYLGEAEYVDNKLESIYVEEGRIVYDEDGKVYPEYFLKDHLGNVRVRIADKNLDNLVHIDQNNPEDDELMNTRHYYPFGMEWDTPNLDLGGNSLDEVGVKNSYSYNGKEFLDDLNINLHDYGFRYYDPAIARFTTIDPLAEEYDFQSGYAYAINNPILFRDIMGLGVETKYKKEGTDEVVEIDDGVDKTIEVNEENFEKAKEFASRIDSERSKNGYVDFRTEWEYQQFASENDVQSTFDKLWNGPIRLNPITKGIVPDIGKGKGVKLTISAIKKALKEVHKMVGKLPKGKKGKFGSPQRGNSTKGYRLDKQGHPNTTNPNETGPHINWWDFTKGKFNKGRGLGKKDAVPIKD